MNRDLLYTLRWYAKHINSKSSEAPVKKAAQEMILKITKELGEADAGYLTPPGPIQGAPVKIAVIIGHTEKSPGAYSKHLKMSEYVYNTDLALRLQSIGEERGLDVRVFTRDKGGIKGAFQDALKIKPAAIIELHFNAFNGKASGTEVLFSNKYDAHGLRELELAQILSADMASGLGLKNRGAKGIARKGERGFHNLAQTTNKASVLIESGFGDNKVDAKAMENRDALAKSILNGIQRWIAN